MNNSQVALATVEVRGVVISATSYKWILIILCGKQAGEETTKCLTPMFGNKAQIWAFPWPQMA